MDDNHHRTIRRTAAVAGMVMTLGVLSTLPAAASPGGGGVERRGDCSKSSEWRFRADPDNGRIKVEAEVDSGVTGQTWSWRLTHNGGLSAKGTSVTHGGSYKVDRTLVDAPGTDKLGFRSTNTASGEVCVAHLSF